MQDGAANITQQRKSAANQTGEKKCKLELPM
jgi:hypothetical protein